MRDRWQKVRWVNGDVNWLVSCLKTHRTSLWLHLSTLTTGLIVNSSFERLLGSLFTCWDDGVKPGTCFIHLCVNKGCRLKAFASLFCFGLVQILDTWSPVSVLLSRCLQVSLQKYNSVYSMFSPCYRQWRQAGSQTTWCCFFQNCRKAKTFPLKNRSNICVLLWKWFRYSHYWHLMWIVTALQPAMSYSTSEKMLNVLLMFLL